MSNRNRLLLFLTLCIPAPVGAELNHEVVTTRTELEAHLGDLKTSGSPLGVLSESGRQHFIDNLAFTDEGIIPLDHAALYLELAPAQIRDVLALFGRENMAPHAPHAEKPTLTGHGSRHLDPYYRYLEALRKINGPATNTRQGNVQEEMHNTLMQAFGPYFGPAALSDQAPSDLRVLHEAVSQVLFHTHAPELLALSQDIAGRIAKYASERKLNVQSVLTRTHGQLLAASEFEQAAEFAKGYGLPPVDWRVDVPLLPAGPMVLVPEQRPDVLVLRATPVSLDKGVHVVATVSPACSFSLAATRYVEAHDDLRSLLQGRTTWAVDPVWATHLDKVLEWNRDARATTMHVAYRGREWPQEIELGRTPMFYVYKDGELMETVAGWADASQGEKLQALLAELLSDR